MQDGVYNSILNVSSFPVGTKNVMERVTNPFQRAHTDLSGFRNLKGLTPTKDLNLC